MKKKHYYKGLDENLRGLNSYQYEVGKEYSAGTDNKYHWLHFAEKVSGAFPYGPRIVEVEPVTKVNRYNSTDLNAEKIRIVRELSADEVVNRLFEENYPLYLMDKIRPSYAQLLRHKDHIKRCDHRAILHWDWLTPDQKRVLLPKSWERYIRAAVNG